MRHQRLNCCTLRADGPDPAAAQKSVNATLSAELQGTREPNGTFSRFKKC